MPTGAFNEGGTNGRHGGHDADSQHEGELRPREPDVVWYSNSDSTSHREETKESGRHAAPGEDAAIGTHDEEADKKNSRS